ncbi:tRNA (adenosine(37)-N6)-dimethylallyltransferase MiaA [Lentilactobacillus hilgardii]|uniref:tRNA dimethylallyltransferase n=1 Tax=Lentilactobacillus hilgardii TaxID=1588 RepID=A0A6P1E647_LENHI|nr:tRNA (adenosine(37)-N6)-dimethylallyltransferase MiaA [Lentilactobacillus hilgardii]EEI70211.1 tRNA dimethylallyltransferase [Lentilactobacillus hilgardii ATCC 27305]MCT3391687.1 tRNA (adenosine(37)-N6)-dimethylallyltransferase MiaA [Lentilactobacillus hilgardii]QHB52198.1 tRNA (adenosine(37)-N6)-dimethylallyltransferase MiaA [Lentilactobacillus hilgardii]RRG11966.1 MAG: tRNA (adenosine(37)-N6)-dimethylallyltransferase MiaA [Lactobacillus sp.]
MKKVLAIVGPTAVGKTAMSIKLAKMFRGEVISGDSMQVYRNLNIGTAKITEEEKEGVVHHLIDVRDIDQRFSVADFVSEATKLINEISIAGNLPIIVGGTGFYLQALLDGLDLGGDRFENDTLRQQLLDQAKEHGNAALHEQLERVDPQAAKKIPANNLRRVIRALEVYIKTGNRFSDQENQPNQYDSLIIGLTTDRKKLYDRINHRVDLMMTQGLLKEADYLYKNGGDKLQAGKGIGYHEFYDYFKNQISLTEAVDLVKKDSRHYAKRQLTWFRNKTKPNWYDVLDFPDDVKRLEADVGNWLENRD